MGILTSIVSFSFSGSPASPPPYKGYCSCRCSILSPAYSSMTDHALPRHLPPSLQSPTIAARREGGQNQPGDPGIWFPRGAEERYRERGRLRLEWERAEAKRQKEEAKKQKEEAKRQKEEKKRQAAAPVDDGTHKDIINNPW